MVAGVSGRSEDVTVIFLDCNGVLVDYSDEKTQIEINTQLVVLTAIYPDRSDSLLRKKAEVNSFSRTALANFEGLIQKISNFTTVYFVITSMKDGEQLEDLQNFVFEGVFSKGSIKDKTADSQFTYELDCSEEPSPSDLCLKKYGFSLDDERGREIDYWLRENHEQYGVNRILILEKENDSESKLRYPNHVVHMEPGELFSEKTAEKCHEIVLNYPFSKDLFPTEKEIQLREEESVFSCFGEAFVSEPFAFLRSQLNT